MQQKSLPVLQQKNNEITKAYGDRDKFLMTFNPDVQQDICGDPDICFFGGAPTLGQLNTTYGSQTAAMWLVPQLYNLSEYCGCKEKLLGRPLEECASVIATEFYFLSVSELMLFFHRFKSGRYGRFYGSVDPLVITTSLRDFIVERNNAYMKKEQEEYWRKQEESRKNAITWEEYCMRQYGEIRPHPSFKPAEVKKRPKPKEDQEEIYRMAKWLVSETIKNIKDTYGRIFKKKYGCTPEEYINNHKDLKKSHT